jgi:O-antigen ligase
MRSLYRSTDVIYGGNRHFRIPATFTGSAAYAGNMVASMPLLLGALSAEWRAGWWRNILIGGVAASAIGVFLAASRSAAVVLIAMAALVTLSGRLKRIPWAAWVALILGIGWLVAATPRMQGFLSLEDTQYIKARVHGSVNEGFFEVMAQYPMGNGLGGGGTSVPYFLQDLVKDSVGVENEYARIMLEEGIPGLMLWVAFIAWLLTRSALEPSDPWYTGRWLARLYCLIMFSGALIGTGTLTSIPATAMLMVCGGWVAAPVLVRKRTARDHGARRIPLEALRQA